MKSILLELNRTETLEKWRHFSVRISYSIAYSTQANPALYQSDLLIKNKFMLCSMLTPCLHRQIAQIAMRRGTSSLLVITNQFSILCSSVLYMKVSETLFLLMHKVFLFNTIVVTMSMWICSKGSWIRTFSAWVQSWKSQKQQWCGLVTFLF